MFAVDFDVGDVVLEDGWDIDLLQEQFSALSSGPFPLSLFSLISHFDSALTRRFEVRRVNSRGKAGLFPHLREGTLGEDTGEEGRISHRCTGQV